MLLYGAEILGRDSEDGVELAHAVAESGIKKYDFQDCRWPVGISGGESPCLLLGLAGVGYFYLRMHDPTTPSVLGIAT